MRQWRPPTCPVASDNALPPPVLRNNALMDALFRNVTRFFAFLVFSLLAAILVSLLIGGCAVDPQVRPRISS